MQILHNHQRLVRRLATVCEAFAAPSDPLSSAHDLFDESRGSAPVPVRRFPSTLSHSPHFQAKRLPSRTSVPSSVVEGEEGTSSTGTTREDARTLQRAQRSLKSPTMARVRVSTPLGRWRSGPWGRLRGSEGRTEAGESEAALERPAALQCAVARQQQPAGEPSGNVRREALARLSPLGHSLAAQATLALSVSLLRLMLCIRVRV